MKPAILLLIFLSGCGYTIMKKDNSRISLISILADTPGTREYWSVRIGQIRIGMLRTEVERILPMHSESVIYRRSENDTAIVSYWVDFQWKVTMKYHQQNLLNDGEPEVFEIEKLISIPVLTKEKIIKAPVTY